MCETVLSRYDLEELAHLLHEVILVVQTACRVDDQDIRVTGFCGLDGVVDDRSRITAVLSRNDRHFCALRPFGQLLRSAGTERIRRGDQDRLALPAVEVRQFSDRGSLSDAVHADHEDQ